MIEDLFFEGYAQGAKNTTAGKPMVDGNIDMYSSEFASRTRKEIKYLNVNTTEIPAAVESLTLLTMGSMVNTQVETADDNFNDNAERIISFHEKIGVGELTNKYNGNTAKKLMSNFDIINGGFLIVHHYSVSSGWKFPYRYEIVSVDMVDTSKTYYRADASKPRTTNGIEYNKYNQPKAIWLYTDEYRTTSKKVSMKNITYYSETWISLGQQLAVSKLISMLPTLDRIDQYTKAALDEQIEAAKAGGYLHTSAFEEIMSLIKEEIDRMPGATLKTKKDKYKEVLSDFKRIGVTQNGLTPVPLNDTVTMNNKDSSSIYDAMQDNSERKMASSLGTSQMSVFKRIDKANYSSSKLALEFDAKKGESRFDNLKDVINEINKRICITAVQIGELKAPKDFFKNIDRFLSFRYIRKTDINIEPSKRAAADEKNIALKIDSKRNIVESRYGIKYETFLKNLKKDEDLENEILGRTLDVKEITDEK